jgi:hypothetical protein
MHTVPSVFSVTKLIDHGPVSDELVRPLHDFSGTSSEAATGKACAAGSLCTCLIWRSVPLRTGVPTAAAFSEVLNNLASTNVSMVAAMEGRNKIAREEGSRQQQDADLRKYTQFLEILKDTNLPEDRRNKLEAYCSEYEETM